MFQPKSTVMWVEALEQRVLLAAPDFLAPTRLEVEENGEAPQDGRAFNEQMVPSSFSEGSSGSAAASRASRDDIDLVIFIV